MGELIERIPHPKIAYAYLEVRGTTFNEFESLRSEALKKHPLYGPSALESTSAAAAAGVEVEVQATEADAAPTKAPVTPEVTPAEVAVHEESAPAAGPTSTEGLSPREIAKLRMQQKKEATNG